MPFSDATLARLNAIVDGACADPTTDIPGTAVVVVGRDGSELFARAAGRRGLATKTEEPMSLDSVFWIASCTKLLAGIACMQLVEQGVLRLDDGEQVETLCPEIADVQVLTEDGTLVPKNKRITLRMLLSHTAGFGYTFFNERLRDWALPAGFDEFSGRAEDVLGLPLVFQPGEGWEYGTGIDWAGLVLERATGLKLNDYIRKNIAEPLGIKDMSMVPDKDMRARVAYMHQREHDGRLRPRDHLQRTPLVIDPESVGEKERLFNSGGAGMFSRPREYCKVLATLLNNGTSPLTNAQLLRPETVDEMFRNQIPDFPDFGKQSIPAAKPDLTLPIPELYPVADGAGQGWGLTFMRTGGGATGRSKDAVHWAGLANLWWWCDREKGVAGMVATQILPFVDGKVLGLWGQLEATAYEGLKDL